MSNKRYRLLKDLPDVKAGAILTDIGINYYCEDIYGGEAHLSRKLVETNPEWFEEIKEQQPFLWSDELVEEYAISTHFSNKKSLQQFKASKQQTNTIPSEEKFKIWDMPMNARIKPEPKTERIKVSVGFVTKNEFGNWYQFCLPYKVLLGGKEFYEVKKSIESVLNNDTIPTFTKFEYLKGQSDAFNAGRKSDGIMHRLKFKTFNDYLDSKT